MSHCGGNIPSRTTSETFNQATGDFGLISSDETIFYVPRAVLQLSSKVFETMLEAGTPSAENQAPIQVQADAKHLEMILKLAHPGHISPFIFDVATLAELLRIAKQYEMESVTDQLRVWFVKPRVIDDIALESIVAEEPLAAFVAAISFDCIDEARYALKEVVKCDLDQELGTCKKYEIPLYLMQYILKLRTERAAWWKKTVSLFSQSVMDSCHEIVIENAHSRTREDASHLMAECVRWERCTSQQLDARPSLTTFKALLCDRESGAIAKDMFRHCDIKLVWNMIQIVEEGAPDLESTLPELGKSLGG